MEYTACMVERLWKMTLLADTNYGAADFEEFLDSLALLAVE
jgi:hypothetical protein